MTRSLFATKLYEAEIGDEALLAELAHSIRSLGGRRRGRTALVPRAPLCRLHQLRLAQRLAQARSGVRRPRAAPDAATPPPSPTTAPSTSPASRSSTACGSTC